MTNRLVIAASSTGDRGLSLNANTSNAVYTNNGHVYPYSLALNYIIKF